MIRQKPLLFFLILLILLSLTVFFTGNNEIFLFFNQKLANPTLDFIVLKILMPLFTLLIIIPTLMIFSQKYRSLAIISLISGPLSYLIGNLIKLLFQFPRPYDVLPARVIGPWHLGQFSFPSSTTMLAFGLALPIFLAKPKSGSLLLLLAFLVGFSVIYTGFHFPRDVLAGIFLSLLISVFLEKIWQKFFKT